jgi:hypothetical protein
MKVACYVEPERYHKSLAQMREVAAGCNGFLVDDIAPVRADDHIIGGGWKGAQTTIQVLKIQRNSFWHLDGGWIREGPDGRYYRATRNGMVPKKLDGCSTDRLKTFNVTIKPWRKNGRHILVCPSSEVFGRAFGIDSKAWHDKLLASLRAITDRPVVVRPKPTDTSIGSSARPLAADLAGAWAVVVHTSVVGVQAVLEGIPVFCERSCGAAMVGSQDFNDIENPIMPDNREEWISSLVWQQFSLKEFRSGFAWNKMMEFK